MQMLSIQQMYSIQQEKMRNTMLLKANKHMDARTHTDPHIQATATICTGFKD